MCNVACDLCGDFDECEIRKIVFNNDINLALKYIKWLWEHDRPDSQKTFNEKLEEFFNTSGKH